MLGEATNVAVAGVRSTSIVSGLVCEVAAVAVNLIAVAAETFPARSLKVLPEESLNWGSNFPVPQLVTVTIAERPSEETTGAKTQPDATGAIAPFAKSAATSEAGAIGSLNLTVKESGTAPTVPLIGVVGMKEITVGVVRSIVTVLALVLASGPTRSADETSLSTLALAATITVPAEHPVTVSVALATAVSTDATDEAN
jgi:hypothetical protein